MKQILLLLFYILASVSLLFSWQPINAQVHADAAQYPQDYFRSPLGIPLVLSGTFGELRNNHFHAGIDVKTQGKEGLNVYAVADGYVSRIRISPYGYGRALYIDHPNGYTSVYGHLKTFNKEIEAYIKKKQYETESFDINLEGLSPDLLKVTKGSVIALSGNTGGSGGPHLHFEIRETVTEHPINPLLFGMKVSDKRKPLIKQLAFYGFDNDLHSSSNTLKLDCKPQGSKYTISKDTVKLNTDIFGISVKTYDQQDGADNKNGIYSIRMMVDGELQYEFKVDKLSFDEMRYLNAHCDYKEWHNNRAWLNKCFVEPSNQLNNYLETETGHVFFEGNSVRKIELEINDLAGNESLISFYVKQDSNGTKFEYPSNYTRMLYHSIPNEVVNEQLILSFPADAFYNDVFFNYEQRADASKSPFSQVHEIHRSDVPVHKPFDISIHTEEFPEHLKEKALVVYEARKRKNAIKPEYWSGNFLKAKSKQFGDFYVRADVVPPVVKPVYTYKDKNIGTYDLMRFKITDDLAGIQSYRGELDGEWVLMEYEPKKAQLRHYFEDDLSKGKHHFKLSVKDGCGNETVLEFDFYR